MKKKLFVILIAILSVIPFTLIMPEASSTILKYDTVTTSYGSYSYTITKSTDQIEFGFEQWGFSIPFAEGSTITFEYNFNKAYSGRFDLFISNNTSWVWNTCYVMVDGGYFGTPLPTKNTATTGKTFQIYVNNTDHIVVTFISSASTLFNASTSISISANYLVDGVELSDIDSTLDLYLPNMSTSLANLYNGIGYDGNVSTSLSADTLAYDISIIKNYIDGIEGYLSGTNGYIDQLEGYVDNLESQLDILTQITPYNFPLWQYSAIYFGYTYSLTNTYDKLQFYRGLPYFRILSTDANNTFDGTKSIRLYGGSSISLYMYSSFYPQTSNITLLNENTDNAITISINARHENSQGWVYSVITFTNTSTSVRRAEIEFNSTGYFMPLFLGNTTNVPDEVLSIMGLEYDNTYTRLLQTIANGVGGTSYDTSEYDQLENIVDNLNDSLLVDVNTSKNDILTDISNQGGSSTDLHLNNVRIAINGLFNDIFTIFPPLKYLVVVGLILLVLGVIL